MHSSLSPNVIVRGVNNRIGEVSLKTIFKLYQPRAWGLWGHSLNTRNLAPTAIKLQLFQNGQGFLASSNNFQEMNYLIVILLTQVTKTSKI